MSTKELITSEKIAQGALNLVDNLTPSFFLTTLLDLDMLITEVFCFLFFWGGMKNIWVGAESIVISS